MAKVLIAALGTGKLENKQKGERKYEKTRYKFLDGGSEYETPFVAAAISKHLQIDRIFLVGTSKSMWEGAYDYFVEEAGLEWDIAFREVLEQKLEQSGPGQAAVNQDHLAKVSGVIDSYLKKLSPSAAGGSKCYLMDYGVNQQEMETNIRVFMDIASELKPGDEIYLDITHSFRSIPLFMYIMLDFVATLRLQGQLTPYGVYYGMFEANREFGYTPIVDLKIMFEISRWVKVVYDFVNYGNGYLMADLLGDRKIAEPIQKISELININYLPELRREVDRLNGLLTKSDAAITPFFGYLLPYLKDFAKTFAGINSNAEFQFRLARWYFDNKRYTSGYICLAESIVTRILELYEKAGEKVSLTKKRYRDKAKEALYKLDFRGSDGRQLSSLYQKISDIRNRIAHAGFDDPDEDLQRRPKYDVKKDIAAAHIYMEKIRGLLFQGDLDRVAPELKRLPAEIPFRELQG